MRWRVLLAVVLGLSVSNEASFAERPPDGEGSSARGTPHYDTRLFEQGGFIRFELCQGRLLLDPPRHRQGAQHREAPGIYESITVSARRGLPSVHYICQTERQHLTLSVKEASDLRIESTIPATGERSTLSQPNFGPIVWELQRGQLRDRFEAPTLLHLRHHDPLSFRQHFEPLIARVLCGKELETLVERTHHQMMRLTSDVEVPTRAEVEQAVINLGGRQQSTRVAAQRQLLAWGTVVLPLLQTIPTLDHDAEQACRLREIIEQLRAATEDTPASLALLLLNDREYWSQWAGSLEPQQWITANEHLTSIGLVPLASPREPVERIARSPQ